MSAELLPTPRSERDTAPREPRSTRARSRRAAARSATGSTQPAAAGPLDGRAARNLVLALALSGFLEWLGAGSILPLLPLYVRQHGGSDALVGFIMAAFFLASLVVQYPTGRVSDRIGRRPIQLAGLAIYTVGSLAFLALATPGAAIAFRGLQGAGAGMVQVASAALVGDAVPSRWQGRAYGALYGGQTAGLAIGPLLASILGTGSMRIVFLAAAVGAVLAAVPLLAFVPRGRLVRPGAVPRRGRPRSTQRPWRQRAVVGVVVAMVASGLASGTYEVCWSLLLHFRGAASWQIGLSWTLFASPFVLLSLPAGWLVDRLDRRYLAVAAILGSATFAVVYPFLRSVAWLIGLGAVEAATVAVGYPAVMAQLTHSVDPSVQGEAQGFAAAAQTAAIALAALGAGALFGIHPWVPFVTAAGAMVVLAGGVGLLWRGVPGGAGDRPRRPTDRGGDVTAPDRPHAGPAEQEPARLGDAAGPAWGLEEARSGARSRRESDEQGSMATEEA